ncbi:hypothetical protein IHV25_07270 [Phaeovibrio sulfidiphilus]|uniref:Phage protein Gp138 N-terminal domain-containing protein n=1 Tax=Phaeovibrio sulfidiphilus TaxID=1220600 RepID=A0A8J6YQI3_9PROT|nr:hypothetical protein [Phaeovibrio sulfidiphilus]MBE1237447.1 hypothetical protein [Phaeovibrio sulfidiphilus]
MSRPLKVRGAAPLTATGSPTNALSFMMEALVKRKVNTALPVRVDAVEPGGRGPVGYVSVTPLVSQADAYANALEPKTIHHVPYARVQGGACALIVDPQPGDIGIAVFAKRDISVLRTGAERPVQAGSFRMFSEADAMYIGGIVNRAPTVWVEMTGEGEVTVRGPARVRLETGGDGADGGEGGSGGKRGEPDIWMEMTASGAVTVHTPKTVRLSAGEGVVLDTPVVRIAGEIIQTGARGSGATFRGGVKNTGGRLSSNGVTLETHVHPGCKGGSTGTPAG